MEWLKNKKTISWLVLSLFLFVGLAGFFTPVLAADLGEDIGANLDTAGGAYGDAELIPIIGSIINILLGLLGIIFTVLIVYGGFLYMTAGGNEDQVKKAKKFITNAIIGLVIVLAAYAISSFVIDKIVGATVA